MVALDLLVLLNDVLVVLLLGDLGGALVSAMLLHQRLNALQPFDSALVVVSELRILLPKAVHLLVARFKLVLRFAAVEQAFLLDVERFVVFLLVVCRLTRERLTPIMVKGPCSAVDLVRRAQRRRREQWALERGLAPVGSRVGRGVRSGLSGGPAV